MENQPKKRPSMASLVSGLELALELQENTDWSIPEEPEYSGTLSISNSPRSDQSSASKKSLKLKKLKSWRWDLLWNGVKTAKMDSFESIGSVSSSKSYEDCSRHTVSMKT